MEKTKTGINYGLSVMGKYREKTSTGKHSLVMRILLDMQRSLDFMLKATGRK